MKIYKQKGIYGEGDVYTIYSLEDWDAYEKICKEKDPEFLKYNPNFYSFKEDFIKYVGKIWQDKNQLKHTLNGVPLYVEYKVIGIEDNNPMMDWYWVLENVDDPKNTKHLLANSYDLQDGLKTYTDKK